MDEKKNLKVMIIVAIVVLVFIVLTGLIFYNLKNGPSSALKNFEKNIATENEQGNEKEAAETEAIPNSPDSQVGPVKTPETMKEDEKYASAPEKNSMGIRGDATVKVLMRRADGRILSYEIVADPQRPDTDGDFLFDDEEDKYGTDKNNIDTDADGVSDWMEIANGKNPKIYDDYTQGRSNK